jgi:hypothetical protein
LTDNGAPSRLERLFAMPPPGSLLRPSRAITDMADVKDALKRARTIKHINVWFFLITTILLSVPTTLSETKHPKIITSDFKENEEQLRNDAVARKQLVTKSVLYFPFIFN